jgi:hypothetical protein
MQIIDIQIRVPDISAGQISLAKAQEIAYQTGRKLTHLSCVLEHLLDKQEHGLLLDVVKHIRQINYQAHVEIEIDPERPKQRKYKYDLLTLTVEI